MAGCKIHILSGLTHRNVPLNSNGIFFFCSRKLSRAEIRVIRSTGLKRYYLKPLSAGQEQKFFSAFGELWEKVVKGKGADDPFWRNGVSSKMQEWENSAGYLAVTLFALSQDPLLAKTELIVLPDSVEEASVWRAWGLAHDWTVVSYTFGLWQGIRQELENGMRALRLAGLFLRKKWRARPRTFQIRPGAFLVVTLFYRRVFDRQEYEDLFFGDLRKENARSERDIFYLGDAIDGLESGDQKRMGKESWPVSIYSLLSWPDMFAGLSSVLMGRPRFVGCSFAGVDFSAVLTWHARRSRYDHNLTAEFFYRAVRRACQRCRFDKMLFAFEGNAYERAVIQAFRRMGHGVIDAYSHAVIYPLNLKLYLSVSEIARAPQPDRYLVCGSWVRDAFMRVRRVQVPVISVCSLRAIPRTIERAVTQKEEILVVLDGVWSTVHLVNWLYENRNIFTKYKVFIRPHPNVNGPRLFSQCPQYQEGVFAISNRSLQEDLRQAACVLYRQSSVGVTALMNAVPVIHLRIDLPLSGDPLEGLEAGKLCVEDAEGLRQALLRIPDLQAQLNDDQGKAIDIARHYFDASSSELIRPFLEIFPLARS
ncbi:MAG: hypothetical protein Q7K71_03390 [Candidatus Omnitrophota bacterium]|nr:hypothetical protein [Candidatus Omnitrophota bacterium]